MCITLGVASMSGTGNPVGTMARWMSYRVYPLLVASALGYLIGVFAARGL